MNKGDALKKAELNSSFHSICSYAASQNNSNQKENHGFLGPEFQYLKECLILKNGNTCTHPHTAFISTRSFNNTCLYISGLQLCNSQFLKGIVHPVWTPHKEISNSDGLFSHQAVKYCPKLFAPITPCFPSHFIVCYYFIVYSK